MGWKSTFKQHLSSLALICLTGALFPGLAGAIALAPISLQSFLGENLHAEIEILNLSPQEAASLKAAMAGPAAYLGMGMEYNASLGDAQVEVLVRANGSRYIKLRTSRPLNEPSVDLVLEISTTAAKLIRPYRLLLDPGKPNETAAIATDLPDSQNTTTQAVITKSTESNSIAPNEPMVAPALQLANPSSNEGDLQKNQSDSVMVSLGDTAVKIASRFKPEGSSMEQMLVALMRMNPQAFPQNNVNVLSVGSSITIPSPQDVNRINHDDAVRALAGQYRVLHAAQRAVKKQIYKAKGNELDPAISSDNSKTLEAKGNRQPGDALKLSKKTPAQRSENDKLEQIARQKTKETEEARAKELTKNIQDLADLSKATEPVLPKDSGAGKASIQVQNPATEPASAASRPNTGVAVIPAASPAVQPPPNSGIIDKSEELISQNWVELLAILSALGVVLGALAWLRRRKPKSAPAAQFAGNLPSESWTAVSDFNDNPIGGYQIDTKLGASRVVPENSAIATELDPVAEADVYLAYGKDEPAEEILREGLAHDPKRVAIHLKLAEIYAKRGDQVNFEVCANEVAALCASQGSQWQQIQEWGLALDPNNPRYRSAESSASPVSNAAPPMEFDDSLMNLNPQKSKVEGLGSPLPPGKPAQSAASALDSMLSFADSMQADPEAGFAKDKNAGSLGFGPLPLDRSAPQLPLTTTYSEQLETSMELAKQFIQIGEFQGARRMLDDVIANGSDELRNQAQAQLK
jgi:pilus assembly protein FimV